MGNVMAVAISCNLNASITNSTSKQTNLQPRENLHQENYQPLRPEEHMFVQDSLVSILMPARACRSMTLASGNSKTMLKEDRLQGRSFCLYGGGLMGLSALVGSHQPKEKQWGIMAKHQGLTGHPLCWALLPEEPWWVLP